MNDLIISQVFFAYYLEPLAIIFTFIAVEVSRTLVHTTKEI